MTRSQRSASRGRHDRSGATPGLSAAGVLRSPLELDAVQSVLLELLGDAPPRQAAVPGAPGDVALVLGQEPEEVFALDLADQVFRQRGEPAVDVDQGAALASSRQLRRRGSREGSSRRMAAPSAKAIADLIAFSSSRTFPGQSCWSRACMASLSISVTGVARVDR